MSPGIHQQVMPVELHPPGAGTNARVGVEVEDPHTIWLDQDSLNKRRGAPSESPASAKRPETSRMTRFVPRYRSIPGFTKEVARLFGLGGHPLDARLFFRPAIRVNGLRDGW